MGRLEVQGIVSSQTGEPLVQLRQLDEHGIEKAGAQLSVMEAREVAQNILEAATNAVYDAALISMTNEMWPDHKDLGWHLISSVRKHRADRWGLPDQPEDWRNVR